MGRLAKSTERLRTWIWRLGKLQHAFAISGNGCGLEVILREGGVLRDEAEK